MQSMRLTLKRPKIKLSMIKFLALFLLLVSNTVSAKLTQTIDRTDISAGETFVLDIQIDGETNVQPDLSLIPSSFTIVSNSQYQHTQIVNGSRSAIKGWKIKLKTLQTGKVTIPSITVGNESTKPIVLTIKDSSDQLDLNGQSKAIFLEAEVDQEDAYVQQQIIYTISLYRSVNTHYASLTEPTAENSIVEKLGDDVQFEKMINNRRYIVTKRKYAIFPQQSGNLLISPVSFTADVNDNSQRRRSVFLNSTRPVSITTKPINLAVKPKPASASNPWLPAQNVILADKWTPTTNELKVGEPVTWTLLMTVQGLSESQLPELSLPTIDGLQLYPDTPQKERQIDGKGIMGQRIEKYAVIPSKEGTITIPEIKLNWWDTVNNVQKTAILPSKTFNVLAGEAITKEPQPVDLPPIGVDSDLTTPVNDKALKQWQMISAGLLALWLLTLIAYFNKKSGVPKNSAKTKKAQDKIVGESQKENLRLARKAINNGDLVELEKTIINLVKSLGYSNIHSIGSLSNQVSNQELIDKLNSLEAGLYSATQKNHSIVLENKDLDLLINEISGQRSSKGSESIPPLYPR
ncbi:BatD family protein [Aliikangiella coralliicola]|uniref:Protein BatD n=1 Tax=Aliikangiella coralliicola TaxID=2592383 RepID=A0A545TSS2_9GAMM|nr:BatD family protein [Aliikangiella coralliicola]TQV80275.1 protein BatD [Aliikangiella coralliicola]